MVPKGVTLNATERCNGRYFALFYRSLQLWGQLRQTAWLKLEPCCLQQKMSTQNLVFGNVMYMIHDRGLIISEITEKDGIRGTATQQRKFDFCNIAQPSQQ